MVVLYGAITLAVIFAIAAVVVGREARRLDAAPPPANFDLEEATEWVGNRLPFAVSAVLTYDDVRRILELNLDFLRSQGLSASGQALSPDGKVVVSIDEATAYVLDRVRALDLAYDAPEIGAVLQAQFSYFDAIGAIGPEAGPDE
jgi:hypothetical protein